MKASRLAVVFAAAFVVALVRCGGNNTPGNDAGTRDSGTGNVDSGSGGQDSGTGNGTDAGNTGGDGGTISQYCNTSGSPGCGTGLACVGFGNTGGFCSAQCTNTAPCPGTDTCSQGYCFASCTPGGAGCAADQACGAISTTQGVCFPSCNTYSNLCDPDAGANPTACDPNTGLCLPIGPQAFGQPCNGNGNGFCQQGLTCITVSQTATEGFCTDSCVTAACASSPAGAQCAQFQNNQKFCVWPCSGPDAGTCPTGLSCQLVQGTTYLCQ